MKSPEKISSWPQDGLETVSRCPICASSARNVLHTELTDRYFRCAPGYWSLYGCTVCRSAYLDPRPTRDTIGLAYSHYFTHSAKSTTKLTMMRYVRRAFANGYRNARFGTHWQPSNRLGALLVHMLPGQRALLDAEARHLPDPKPGSRLLDIGCGAGDFLVLAGALGWDAEGVDTDAKAVGVATSRGLRVRCGSLDEFDNVRSRFHAITLRHVIEHVHDPIEILKKCYRLLTADGVLWVETPNIDSEGHRIYGRHWRELDAPRHLMLFNWDSLSLALSTAGFKNVTSLPSAPVCSSIFAESEAIAKNADACRRPTRSPRVLFKAWLAEKNGARDVRKREALTIMAWKRG